ncbi:hypothetical protein HNR12_002180 [Streptomonospora nanhaiensis]|uniref:DeoxyPurine in DNA protein A domain-containing protein n=1 Tax=Streptomonospora nanhaiensis TaxID=1323731 RepID=A0A853BKZ7_9ACTN|nr:hypothetical protein [Streptomonospora nanhaiensis]NYI95903.1 hypothetical protein [Streptomonospora nanhaiensis]
MSTNPVGARFYLGTHRETWLRDERFRGVPLFISHRRLRDRRRLPRAITDWALDSGGFTELSMYGRWETPPEHYAQAVARYAAEIGQIQWAAPQDWMCEPSVLAKTGRTVAEHQRLTIDNLLELRTLAPDLPWVPVLQGWHPDDYRRHVDAYTRAGIDLTREPVVGLGSVCRRQATAPMHALIGDLARQGLRLHGFGFKTRGLAHMHHLLASADSLAWSYAARRRPPLPGHDIAHINCANCPTYALRWRAEMLAGLPAWHQPAIFDLPERSAA